MNFNKIMVFILLIAFVSGCSSGVPQEKAEQIAKEFIAKNVKFFAKGDNSSALVEEVNVPTATSYRDSGVWVVVIHVSSIVDGVEKKNDLVVKVDNEGNVVEFNGQKLAKA